MVDLAAVKVVTLPFSKYKVRLRRPSLITLIATGGFPTELASVVWKMYETNKNADELAKEPDGILHMASLMESYIPFVLVEPHVGGATNLQLDAEGNMTGTWAMIDVSDSDKRFLFFYGQGLLDDFPTEPVKNGATPEPEVSAQTLATFPEEQARADARPAREPVRAEAVESRDVHVEPAPSA